MQETCAENHLDGKGVKRRGVFSSEIYNEGNVRIKRNDYGNIWVTTIIQEFKDKSEINKENQGGKTNMTIHGTSDIGHKKNVYQ